ncbi:hypothetical protein LCGC14_2540660, partial [marine sediment metagenome]
EDSRREGLAKARLSPKRYRGVASSADEAHEAQRGLEKEGEKFDKVWEVSGDSPDAKQANQDVMLRQGINPETNEPLK